MKDLGNRQRGQKTLLPDSGWILQSWGTHLCQVWPLPCGMSEQSLVSAGVACSKQGTRGSLHTDQPRQRPRGWGSLWEGGRLGPEVLDRLSLGLENCPRKSMQGHARTRVAVPWACPSGLLALQCLFPVPCHGTLLGEGRISSQSLLFLTLKREIL